MHQVHIELHLRNESKQNLELTDIDKEISLAYIGKMLFRVLALVVTWLHFLM